MIHLDTNFLILALVSGTPAQSKLQTWLSTNEDVGISSVAWSEFLCGPLTQQQQNFAQEIIGSPEPFLAADAHKSAELFNATGRRSRSLADCQVAAIALRCDARLATADVSDFVPFQSHGLTIL